MNHDELKELQDQSWEATLIYNFEELKREMKDNNKEIFAYVDKKIEGLHSEIKEGLEKLWDKKDCDSEKIHHNEILSKENKVRIENIEPRITTLEASKSGTMKQAFFTVLQMIITIVGSVTIAVILMKIKGSP